jgi:3-deoxy-7-phosphoheptulonate synthase
MLIVMKSNATAREIHAVVASIVAIGLRAHPLAGATRTAIGITGNTGMIDGRRFENLPGVAEVIRVSKPYKLVTLDLLPEKTVVRIGHATIGGDELAIIAGPCAIENRDQAFAVANAVKQSGARFFRGGVCKPRSSPYSFQGLGAEGWNIISEIRETFGLKIVTEALDESGVELVEQHGDVIQIGARNMQNFPLLKRVGRSKLPVLLKRGMAATLEEWLLAAEYIMAEGNYKVVLCERGIRTFAQHSRNTLDLGIVPAIRRISHLPVIVDPSHSSGATYMVTPLARAAVATGADGIMVEVHNQPEVALSDGAQALTPTEYAQLVEEVRAIPTATARRNGSPTPLPRQAQLLLLDNYDSFTYNLAQAFGDLGANVSVRRNDEISLDDISALAPTHICISPGPCTPCEAGISKEVVRRFGPRIPILGVCLGHQCIAEAYGANIVRAPRLMHGKASTIRHDGMSIFSGVPGPFDAGRYHSLIVERDSVPSSLKVTAQTGEGEIMALRHARFPVFGVQFHPESILTPNGKTILANFLALT